MEDAEIDSQVTDSWTVGVPPTSPVVEETLKRTSRVLSESALSPRVSYNDSDSALEENKEDRCSSDGGSEDSPSKLETSPSKIIFKGFKKRILAQAQENQVGIVRRNSHDSFLRGTREKRGEGKRGKITEYAQYLGLQPAASNPKQTKCTKCNTNNSPTNNSCPQSMLKPQQCTCPPGSTAGFSTPGTSDSSTLPPISSPQSSSAPSAANNFRITRKVYLCAACGTYFENWNLFLHMREIHKRHICLFCLGMFGQAERLSYHLAKKHSVPETSFTSVEDFYNVFKGSCYLICCTCEKVFSETDNFYNHFCSPVQKSRTTAANEVCSLCRQSGTHSSTCSLAESRETGQNATGIPGIQGNIGNTNKESSGVRSKRMLKNNRLKRSEESLLMSYQQKLSEMYARKMNMKSREGNRENASSGDESAPSVTSESLETATTTIPSVLTENEASKSSRDTVSETIMEVSKCTDDFRVSKGFCDEEIVEINSKADSKNESSPCPSPSASPSRSPSPLRRQSDASLYDSVAETIMEVSRCSNDSQQDNTSAEEDDEEANSRSDVRRESRDTGSEADVLVMDDVADLDNDAESANGKEDYDDRLKIVKNERRKTDEETNENEPNEASDSEDECSSNQSENASPSRLNSTGDTEIGSSPEKESQTTSVSVTTVNATDRSLVIKICTNRNAQFSVTSANGTNYGENHDTSRESEENNNGEDSASDKHSNHSGRTSPNSFRGDEDDDEEQSDSDTGKLAVVDEEKQENPAATAENENPGDEEKKEQEESPEVGKNETPQIAIEHDENHDEINVENITSAASEAPEEDAKPPETEKPMEESDGIVLAAEDVPSIDLNVEGLLESMEIEDLLKRCISAASGYCVYCNHARHIAVNGKQLSLHVLAEHRFQPQHPAIIINRDQFTARIKKSIDEVETLFFNLNTFNSERGTYEVQNPRVFECFHCRFHSLIHKDIYLHNRKMHQKTILICIMCKSTFYSYSELLCHLCPGVYSPNINVTYRCCLCTVSNLPSAFRLMVHLRKRHHSCDVCLESTGNQQRLSNHVWKHKLHHLCYRCGIAYRNKPDITKHLFWKHGTESVLCKKCLQKKWPHVYHFCIPPTAFVCEECTSTFSRAVALKVHKRLHSGDRPYACNECPERFISKKLLAKHEMSHREPEKLPEVAPREKTPVKEVEEPQEATETTSAPSNVAEPEVNENTANETKEPKEIVKKVVDVYDLPPLNLSSESDSESEEEKPSETAAKSLKDEETKQEDIKSEETKKEEANSTANADVATNNADVLDAALDPDVNEEVKEEEAQIMDGIWDNFKSYAASLEKPALLEPTIAEKEEEARMKFLCEVILADHDYCVVSTEKIDAEELKEDPKIEDNCGTMEGEHDYGHKPKSPSTESVVLNCDSDTNVKKKKEKSPKKRKQNGSTSSSDSSSDSDSSSCSCGTNCSCSSSSSGSSSSSSSSSDSDSSASESSPKKSSSARKERKEEKKKEAAAAATAAAAAEAVKNEVKVEEVEENPPENPVFEETPQQNEEANQSIEICEPPRSPQLIFRESDLDTDETETDEDFYDEHPQQLANKLLAEKRNQLMLLAAVAPASNESPAAAGATSTANNLNNGQIDVDTTRTNSIPTEDTNEEARNSNARGQTRKKVKTKKRKKAERTKSNRVATPTVESIKLNIPKSFYQKKQPGFNSATPAIITVLPSRSSTPNLQNSQPDVPAFTQDANKTNLRLSVGGSGSETENKRSSKRKRVPKRFYDDSSDEEAERQQQQQQQQQLQYNQPNFKWRKVDNPNFVPTISIKTQPTPSVNFPTKNVTLRLSGFDQPLERIVPMNTVNAAASATESEEAADSSSAESSEAEVNVASQASQPIIQQPRPTILPPNPSIIPTNSTGGPERSVNLYCYCQCPYDEVSEMIACDGDDCRIEWFHFECVGIMVPPKGKWYCPDCRKKDASLPSNEDYFD